MSNNYIVVNGCIIEDNAIYEVHNRSPREGEAMNVYRNPLYDSVKEKMKGVGNVFSFATYNNMYNTGFHANSEVFDKDPTIANDWEKREKKAKEYFKFIMEPLRPMIYDIDKAKEPLNYSFFENPDLYTTFFKVELDSTKSFNTQNPYDRLQLYIAIITGNICMQGKRTEDEKKLGLKDEDKNIGLNTQYVYSSIKNSKSKLEKQGELEIDAYFEFASYLKSDKELLVSILNKMGSKLTPNVADIKIKTLFKTAIANNNDNLSKFLSYIREYEKNPKTFNKEILITEQVKSPAGKQALIKQGNKYFIGDVSLGTSVKSIVSKFMKDEELYQKFLNIADL